MDHAVRFRETLHRLAMIDERFVEDEAGLGLGCGALLQAAEVGHADGPIDRPLAADERLARVTAHIVQEAHE